LLVGDYLFVSKLSYGPRSPMTPLSFPLAQHTLPVLECKSYIEKPQWEYNRLKGFGNVKHNDIVVFNFPAGDTVAEKMQNVDYYSLVERFGRDHVWNNPHVFGKIITRPVDRRENYVKRAVALPGDVLELKDGALYLNGVKQNDLEGLQFNYFVETTSFYDEKMFSTLGISKDDRMLISQGNSSADSLLMNLGYRRTPAGHFNFVYHFPMTKSALAKLKAMDRGLVSVMIESDSTLDLGKVFPYKLDNGWTRDNFGPIWMPKKGETVDLDLNNIAIYEQIIRNYELNTLEVKDRQIFINGAPASSYTFKMDYYWMMGDNRHNSSDSRYWGFVPEDHIVGKPIFVWMSIDKDKSGFSSVRTERIFKKIHD
jgi:signal peptidase I